MSNVKRIYVEKKAPYDIRAKELKSELISYLRIRINPTDFDLL